MTTHPFFHTARMIPGSWTGVEPEMVDIGSSIRALAHKLPLGAMLAATSLAVAPFSGFLYRNRELAAIGDLWHYVLIYVGSLLIVVVGISLVFGRRVGSRWSFLLGWCAFALFWYRDVKAFSDELSLTEGIPFHGPVAWILATASVLFLIFFLCDRSWFQSGGIWFAVTVALLPLGQYALFTVTAENYETDSFESVNLESHPDIYFLMVDGFGRQDVLQELFNIDTSDFVEELRREGFVVADRALGAHPMTWLSIPAILDQKYQAQPGDQGRPATTRQQMSILAGASKTHQVLLTNGYNFVIAADSSWMLCNSSPISELMDCVVDQPEIDAAIKTAYVRYQLAYMTPISGLAGYGLLPDAIAALWQGPAVIEDEDAVGGKAFLASDVLGVVDTAHARDDSTPLFVYAHMMYTHPPFTLGPKCKFKTRGVPDLSSGWDNISGYQDGIDCTVDQVFKLIREVDPSAVIVIQSDHGPIPDELSSLDEISEIIDDPTLPIEALWARASVLSAVRLPEQCRHLVSDTYAGVSTFKVVFNCLTGSPEPTTPERFYWAWWDSHSVTDLTDRIRSYEVSRVLE